LREEIRQKGHNELDISPLAPMATKNGTNGDPLSPMANASNGHPITIGDRHWSPLAPFKWRQWRH